MFATDIPHLLTFYEAKLSLLLTVSQSKAGAVEIMGAGLFDAVRSSGLFSVDPDIGVGKSNLCPPLEAYPDRYERNR